MNSPDDLGYASGAPEVDHAENTRESGRGVIDSLNAITNSVRGEAQEAAAAHALENLEAQPLLADVAARMEAASRLHRLLGRLDEHGAVSASHYLPEICESASQLLDPFRQISIYYDLADCQVSGARMLALGMIVNEAVINSIRHAHPAGVQGRIDVCCRREAGNGLVLSIQDDGVGLPAGFDPRTNSGLGFRVMRALARQWGAQLSHVSTPLGYRLQIVA